MEIIMKTSTAQKLQAMLGTPPEEIQVPEDMVLTEENHHAFLQNLDHQIAVQTIGQGLREARKRRKLSSRQLAAQVNLSQSRIMQLEQANDELEIRTVAQIAEGLGYRLQLELIPENASDPVISVPFSTPSQKTP
jgi:ribosome-binding protein aMBF1 (putative translation factor)